MQVSHGSALTHGMQVSHSPVRTHAMPVSHSPAQTQTMPAGITQSCAQVHGMRDTAGYYKIRTHFVTPSRGLIFRGTQPEPSFFPGTPPGLWSGREVVIPSSLSLSDCNRLHRPSASSARVSAWSKAYTRGIKHATVQHTD